LFVEVDNYSLLGVFEDITETEINMLYKRTALVGSPTVADSIAFFDGQRRTCSLDDGAAVR
jgi:hypothetical protein